MRLALIGVGLIGASFAKALRAAGKVDSVVGFDSEPGALRLATDSGVIDRAAESAAAAVQRADVVMIATPVGAMREVLREIAQRVEPAAVITDVGSAKASVIEAAREQLGATFVRFVAGHPIAGREHSGLKHADGTLFKNKVFVSVPAEQTNQGALRMVEALWRDVGCRVERMTPKEHDTIFAAVSHLPHLLAFALVAQIAAQPDASRKFALSGAGFRDFTRIAASNPQMWSDVCVANRAALAQELREQRRLLEKLQHAIEDGDTTALQSMFSTASQARSRLSIES